MEIYVNVYNIGDMNGALNAVNMGLFHTGVEIAGSEYSFSAAGVARTRPKLPEFGEFREQFLMGTYPGILINIHNTIERLQESQNGFGPGQYDLLTRNCNHFTDTLCFELLGVHIPSWINRAAAAGASMSNTTPRNDNTAVFPAPGVVNSPASPLFNSAKEDSYSNTRALPDDQASSGIFSGLFSLFGWGKAANTPGIVTATPSPSSGNLSKPTQTTPKQLTEKQKELLAKLKK